MFSKKILIVFFALSLPVFAEEKKAKEECTSTREFITTVNFLKDKKDYAIEEKAAQDIASFVAGGCTGAAGRFIQTVTFLTDAEIPTLDAVKVAKNMSGESDTVANNFITIFKKIYVEKYFDLSAAKSLKMATELTVKMDKDASKLIDDFNTLGDFCMNRNGLDLGYEKCSDFIFSVLIKSKDINKNIAKAAIEFFDFLVKEEKGPKLSTSKALNEIINTAEYGENGMTNYIQAYSFAANNSGPNLGVSASIKFAQDMAHKSFKK